MQLKWVIIRLLDRRDDLCNNLLRLLQDPPVNLVGFDWGTLRVEVFGPKQTNLDQTTGQGLFQKHTVFSLSENRQTAKFRVSGKKWSIQ